MRCDAILTEGTAKSRSNIHGQSRVLEEHGKAKDPLPQGRHKSCQSWEHRREEERLNCGQMFRWLGVPYKRRIRTFLNRTSGQEVRFERFEVGLNIGKRCQNMGSVLQ